ncbi:MAG: nucleoside phosphorylase [Chloroflexia bacterium]
MSHDYPILEYSAQPEGLLEPKRLIKPVDLPEHAVACFFQDVITRLSQEHRAEVVTRLRSEIGTNPVYRIEFNGRPLTVFHPGVGAPLAAAFLEEVIALGCTKFVACGGCGVLDSNISIGHIVVPRSAIRDEGTSYHYLPPSREVAASDRAMSAVTGTLDGHGIPYTVGKTWTTDAIYRETPEKIALRRAEGCIAVEMEAAAFFAVAQFRNVQMAQLLYGGDDVGGETWDGRHWATRTSVREKLFWLAAEACLSL